MNEKISFPDLVGLLSSKMNITKKEAETFLKEFFTVSTEIITSGEELRINGLGLFKPIWVEARGSINIQTGEPVEIPGHYKLSFIPDKVLREAVNAPFSSFSVEVLNDHVPIEDMTAVPSQDIDENNDICNTENVELQDSKEIREKEEEDDEEEERIAYEEKTGVLENDRSETIKKINFKKMDAMTLETYVKAGKRLRYKGLTPKRNENIEIFITSQKNFKGIKVGIIDSQNRIRYIQDRGKDLVEYKFKIEKEGKYDVFIEMEDKKDVKIVGMINIDDD